MQLEDLKGTLEMPFATVNVVAMRLRLLHKVATTCPQYLGVGCLPDGNCDVVTEIN